MVMIVIVLDYMNFHFMKLMKKFYFLIDIETIYLNDKNLEYRKKVIINYSNVLLMIND